ncbi:MAG: DUF2905 family protein [Actinobacteria bacterium]|nr:DUF2905 family protein [Actinomycetota bacterium]
MENAAKLLLAGALLLAALGLGALVLSRLGVDRLPGTIRWKPTESSSVVVPVGLMVVISLVGTIVLNILLRR